MLSAEEEAKDEATKKSLTEARANLASQAAKLNYGVVAQRLRAIITIGEVEGPAEATKAFAKLAELLIEKSIRPVEHSD